MLDVLMEELMDAEREQEGRINALIRADPKPQQPRKVQWLDCVAEELEEDLNNDSDEDSDVDSDIEDEADHQVPIRKAKSPLPKPSPEYFDESDDLYDRDEGFDEGANDIELVLRRWPSKFDLPELVYDSGSDSEDEHSLRLPRDDACIGCVEEKSSAATRSPQDVLKTHAIPVH